MKKLKFKSSSETFMAILCLGILFYFFRPLLTGKTVLAHDNFYWNFPIFHYTAVTLMQGSLPLWDPFSNGGQPFYPHLIQFRLLEPLILFTIGLGQFFTKNTVILFNISKILQTLVMCLGAYLCLKRYASKLLTRLFLIPVLMLSSFFLGGFHQDGILSQFLWVPWLIHFVFCILFDKDTRWFRFLFLSVFIGLSWQSYQFVGTWTLLLFFAISFGLFHRQEMKSLWGTPSFKFKLTISALLIVGMMGPNIALISESSRFVFPLRMAPKDFKERLMNETGLLPTEVVPGDVEIGIKMPYEMIPYTGAMVKVWEILQAFSPNANANIFSFRNPSPWGFPSEAYIYLGMTGWLLALLGFTMGRGQHRKLWLLTTIGFGLLMMGPPGGLHRLLFYVFPPLWFNRHTTLFVLFFVMGCLYFLISGLEAVQERNFKFSIPEVGWATLIPFIIVVFTFGMLATKLDYPVFKFPETNFLFVIFIVLALAGWKVIPLIGNSGLFAALALSQIALVLALTPTKFDSLLHFGFFLALPFGLLLFMKRKRKGLAVLSTAFLLLHLVDLTFSLWSAGRLYEGQESPETLFQMPMTPKPLSETPRDVYPTYPASLYGHQSPRYLGLLHQKSFALSGVLHFRGSPDVQYPQDMAFGLQAKRWNTYLLQKDYFHFIHLNFPPSLFSRLFMIGERPFQFHSNAFPRSVFMQLAETGKGDALLNNAVVIEDSEPLAASASNLNHALIDTEKYTYNSWAGTVRANGGGYFLWGDGFDRFWNVRVDGKAAHLLKLNLQSKGVFIPAGTHHVEFRYQPWPFLYTVALFLLIPALVVLISLIILIRHSLPRLYFWRTNPLF